ncbi:MAG TPA: ABC transporter ATP-binding protein [Anaerolineae bacterium]|nr:ABC transporter ATP-binding protein [Anaerolineae bacterium]
MPSQVTVEHLVHVYPVGEVVALNDVSLTLSQGEIVGVIGQNGSGKTTLVKHFNALLQPTRGRVVVNGIDTTGRRVQEMASHVGYVFQNPNHQLFASTVEQELAFGPQNLGLSPAQVSERVEEAVEFFGLQELRRQHPYRISFPLRKLVSMAAIYAMRPSVFILDEPTTGQDNITTRVVFRLIQRLRDEGATVVCVAHDMQLLAEVVDRVIVMWKGTMIADESPRKVFADEILMARTNLQAPQITTISLRVHHPNVVSPALTVSEFAQSIGPVLRAAQ